MCHFNNTIGWGFFFPKKEKDKVIIMGNGDIGHCFPLLYLKIVVASIARRKTTRSTALQHRPLSDDVCCPRELRLPISGLPFSRRLVAPTALPHLSRWEEAGPPAPRHGTDGDGDTLQASRQPQLEQPPCPGVLNAHLERSLVLACEVLAHSYPLLLGL